MEYKNKWIEICHKAVIRKKMRDIKIALEDVMCDALAEMSSCHDPVIIL